MPRVRELDPVVAPSRRPAAEPAAPLPSAAAYVAVGASWENRIVEVVDHLHEHFVDPVVR